MTKVTCPVCKSTVDRLPVLGEMLPPELDGVPVKRCVAFDRHAGAIWHYPESPDGKLIMAGEEAYVEKLEGVVTVQPLKGGD